MKNDSGTRSSRQRKCAGAIHPLLMTAIALALLFSFCPRPCFADAPWVARYNGPDKKYDYVDGQHSLSIDSHRNVYVTGSSLTTTAGDSVLLKYDANGHPSTTWPDVGYGVGVRRYHSAHNSGGSGVAVVVDSFDNVYVTGTSTEWSFPNPGFITRKYDASGNLASSWPDVGYGMGIRIYNPNPQNEGDIAFWIALDTSNNLYVGGVSEAGGARYAIVKYDANGDPSSSWPDNGDGVGIRKGNIDPRAFTLDAFGNLFIEGSVGSHPDFNIAIIKYDSAGNIAWSNAGNGDGIRIYASPGNDTPVGITVDSLGYVYVLGYSVGAQNNDFVTVKYDPNGDPSNTWPDIGFGMGVRRYAGPAGTSDNITKAIAADDLGSVYVTSYSVINSVLNIITIKYSQNGEPSMDWPDMGSGIGVRRHNNFEPSSIALDASGNVYIGGGVILKYEANGALSTTWPDVGFGIGVRKYNNFAASAMELDDQGDVVATGTSQGTSQGDPGDIVTIKIAANGDSDADGDTILDSIDNCLTTFNPVQNDHDFDGIGDACDTDFIPAPVITSLTPTSVNQGSSAFTLTVTGSIFFEGKSTIRWNGANRATTFVSETQLTAQISAQDVAPPDASFVTVMNSGPGGGTSNSMAFFSTPPPPILTIHDVRVVESSDGEIHVNIPVEIQFPYGWGLDLSFPYSTAPGTASEYNPATQQGDFVPATGTINCYCGPVGFGYIPITIRGDQIPEGNEEFYVDLVNPIYRFQGFQGLQVGEAAAEIPATISRARATVTIANHDTQPPAQSRILGVTHEGTLAYINPQTATVSPVSTIFNAKPNYVNDYPGDYAPNQIGPTAVNSRTREFYWLRPNTTGGALTIVNTETGASMKELPSDYNVLYDLEFNPSTGQLFAVTWDPGVDIESFGILDPETGTFSVISEITLHEYTFLPNQSPGYGGVLSNLSAFDTATSRFFFVLYTDSGVHLSYIASVNTQTGIQQVIPLNISDIQTLDFDPQTHNLYVISNDQLGTVDPDTGIFVPLMTVPFPIMQSTNTVEHKYVGSGFHPATRRFFAMSEDSDGRHIVTINVDTLQSFQSPPLDPNVERLEFESLANDGQVDVNQTSEVFSPPVGDSAGAKATLTNNTQGTGTATVSVESLGSVPGRFKIGSGDVYVDIEATGVDSTDVLTVKFYYPTTLDSEEPTVTLRYFNSVSHTYESVLGSGGTTVTPNTTNNQDGTVSGGSFAVVFDNTSTPKITELPGIPTPVSETTHAVSESRMVALTADGSMSYINTQTGVASPFAQLFYGYFSTNIWPMALNPKSHMFHMIYDSSRLFSVNTETGVNRISFVDSPNLIWDMEADPVTNQLYVITRCCPAQFGTLNPTTGTFSAINDIPLSSGQNVYGVSTLDPSGHRLFFFYGSGGNNWMASLDTQTGAVTTIAPFPINDPQNPDWLSGFEFDAVAQKLYIVSNEHFWIFDLVTQQFATPITTQYVNYWTAFHGSIRSLLTVVNDQNGQHIVTMNVDTLQTTISPPLNPQIYQSYVFEFEAITETSDAGVNQTTETSNAPDDAGESGVTATLTNNTAGSGTATVTVENLGSVSGDFELGSDTSYVDVRATGVDAGDVLHATFYYPTTLDSEEPNVILRYLNPVSHLYEPVLGSGGAAVAPNTANNQDGTVSGGSFSVVFDNSSTPKITELTGTVFAFVAPEETSTLLASAPNPAFVGQSVSIVASVTAQGGGQASGFVTFTDNGSVLGTLPLVNGGAELVTSSLTAGTHAIKAIYEAVNNFAASSSTVLNQIVQRLTIDTSTTISSSVNPSTVGQSVTFTALVTPSSGSGTPTGNVRFNVDGNLSAISLVSGSASLTISFNIGTHSITATYLGDTKFNSSSSAPFAQRVLYNFSGFFAPVDNPPVYNRVKAGSAIPVKFKLAGSQGLSILAAGSPASLAMNCSNATVDDVEQTVTASNSGLTYNASANQYIYTWKTDKTWATTCRQLTVTLIDGTSHTAFFTFTK